MIMQSREIFFSIEDPESFRNYALELFRFQYAGNPVYRLFADQLGKTPSRVNTLGEIPFMPVEFFRDHVIVTGMVRIEMIFESSGTTGVMPSRHYIKDLRLYEESFTRTFRQFYGEPSDYVIAALLPSYTERAGSSLVYMTERLIRQSGHRKSGFYRDDPVKLLHVLKAVRNSRILLFGVSFALLDLAEKHPTDLSDVLIMETGGMKGRRKEMTREELHSILREKLNVNFIHSEYGMTELLSQAYSKGGGIFNCPPWMKVLVRDPYDPLAVTQEPGQTGGINIIDLANIHSCAFLATGDLGRLHEKGAFEVLGRFDTSDVRGCNLLAV